jgi:hypothetical protein
LEPRHATLLTAALSPLEYCIVLSLLGAGLIVLSVAAFRNANAPEAQLDRALSATLSTLESGGIQSIISKLLAIPFQVLSVCKDAIVNVITFPFRLVWQVIAAVGRAGGTTEKALTNVARWIASLPSTIAQSLSRLVTRGAQTILSRLSDRSRRTWEALAASISASMVGGFARDIASGVSKAHLAMLSAFASLGMALTSLASLWDQVNNSLNDSALAVESFVLSVIGLVAQTGIRCSKFVWEGPTSVNVAGVHLSEYFNTILESLSTSLATITKR